MDFTDDFSAVPGPAGGRRPGSLRVAGTAEPHAHDRVLITGTGLRIPVGLSFESWERAGWQLSGMVDSSSWWLGDWLVYGKKHYTDRYRIVIRAVGLQYQTLRNYAWVSRRFELSRRRAKLSFQHHAEVASLPVAEQDFWLDRAEGAMWTTKQLRGHVRDERAIGEETRRQASLVPWAEVPDDHLGWWRRAADHSGVDFDNWVLSMLDRAAARVLSDGLGREASRGSAPSVTLGRCSA